MRKFWKFSFMYALHRLHGEPRLLAAWRACWQRARLGTPAYWKAWHAERGFD